MRVVFQSRADALSRRGGDTVQMLRTAEELRALGVRVELAEEPVPYLAGVDLVHIFNIQDANQTLRQLDNAARQGVPVAVSTIFWDLRHVYRDEDFVRCHDAATVRLAARLHWRLPYLLLRAKNLPRLRKIDRGIREVLARADLLLPNSYAEAEQLAILYDAPFIRAKSAVVPNAVTLPPADTVAPAEPAAITGLPARYVLQVGRIEYVKGQLKVIRALMDWPEIPLVFVGRGENRHYLDACRRLGERRGNTWFVAEVTHEALPAIYRRAGVHVLPSLRESPGLATLEAALHGANCVVSFHGPVMEYFGDKVWYCDPASAASIGRAIVTAWESPASGHLGERIRTDFTWQQAARATLLAYGMLRNRR